MLDVTSIKTTQFKMYSGETELSQMMSSGIYADWGESNHRLFPFLARCQPVAINHLKISKTLLFAENATSVLLSSKNLVSFTCYMKAKKRL